MGVIAELEAEQRERAARTVPEPATGQVYLDGRSLGFTWRVQWADDDNVFLRMRDRDGQATSAYLNWPRDRWATLVERQSLTLLAD